MTARPRAVVYRGPSRVDRRCADAVAELVASPPWGLDVELTGPRPRPPSPPGSGDAPLLWVQPGGGTVRRAWRRLRGAREEIRSYVAGGGRYLGLCLGGYLAGATPGFDLLPGDADRYIDRPTALVRDDAEAVVPVLWRGEARPMYFQDGPHFVVDGDAPGADVVARYPDGAVAALIAPFGRGRVAVAGPHPEATVDWFDDLVVPGRSAPVCRDLADDLLARLLAA